MLALLAPMSNVTAPARRRPTNRGLPLGRAAPRHEGGLEGRAHPQPPLGYLKLRPHAPQV